MMRKNEWRRRLAGLLAFCMVASNMPTVRAEGLPQENVLQKEVTKTVSSGDAELEHYNAAEGRTLVALEVREEPVNTETYYGFDNIPKDEVILNAIYDDDSSDEVTMWSEDWYALNLHYELKTEEGEMAQLDKDGHYPVGNYLLTYYCADDEEMQAQVEFAVKSWDDAPLLQIGEVETVEVDDSYQNVFYKVAISEIGTYKVSAENTWINVTIKNEDLETVCFGTGQSLSHFVKFDNTGTYSMSLS